MQKEHLIKKLAAMHGIHVIPNKNGILQNEEFLLKTLNKKKFNKEKIFKFISIDMYYVYFGYCYIDKLQYYRNLSLSSSTIITELYNNETFKEMRNN
jgi:hypothetical protein